MTKTKLRAELLQKRRTMSVERKRSMDLEIQSRLLMTYEYRSCDTVLSYVSTGSEIDTLGIISAAFANKKKVAVPVTNDDYSLTFYYINSVKELKRGRFNILEPTNMSAKVHTHDNSICIVPALCCDLQGNRVGYGKGCYDRFLENFDGTKICLVYAENIMPSIKVDSTDIPVDVIISDLYVKHT